MSQVALAEAAGVSFEVVSRAERETATPSLESLERIGATLGVPISALLGEQKVAAEGRSADAVRVADLIDRLPPKRRAAVRRAIETLLSR
ncbi:MAG: helix-turn-helix transcriptional regulator [Deltaproteobacteria bacterium]|nr:helix-turn-helix transcriptional regulator [Deltaproteobacteria bacterium]